MDSKLKSRRKLINPLFHLQTKKEDDQHLTKEILKEVRKTGKLNLSSHHLSSVPEKLFTMYDTTEEVSVDLSRPTREEDAWWNVKPLTHLDLSSNVLTEIPRQIGAFQDMLVLNLHDNSLTGVPPDIGNLTKLAKLTLNRNKITTLPQELFKLTDLTVLSLNSNCLEEISQCISDLVMLVKLDLSDNKIKELPPGMGFLVRLRELNISKNQILELPPDVVNMRSLVKLDISHNSIKELPDMGELRKLQMLYAQHNDIEKIPEFRGCEQIEEIYFGNNYLKEIPLEFCENMFHLKILELRDNQIEFVPKEIINLVHLIKLDLTNNDIKILPNIMGYLPHLKSLKLEGNKPKNIRIDVLRGGNIRIVNYLREQMTKEEMEANNIINPEENTLKKNNTFPDRYNMKNRKILNLTLKHLTTVPEDCFLEAKEAKVSVVDLCKNLFYEVPPGISHLSEYLTELNMSSNKLREVPESLAELSKLVYLNLSKNQICKLPQSWSSLHLRELALSYNKFKNIPECLYDIVSLEILLINDNNIEEINVDGLQKLQNLATLDLGNNNIKQVPPQLGNMTQLRSLELKGNQFRQPRYAVLEQGTEHVLSYLRDKIPLN